MRSTHALILTAALTALATPAFAQQQASDNGTSANGPITIFKNMLPEDPGVTVRIDGREIDHLHMAAYDDVTTTVKPGANTLTISWNHPVKALNFKVAYAPTRNNFKNILVVNVSSSQDPALNQAGSKTMSFNIPG
ncbi:MAG TPA: hypothetical protein VMD91_04055 [Candidatus Sulfotelmatobacter sp.]|nr:hypothetical protein [Candidatus Sulfotelmatobacter sp.]